MGMKFSLFSRSADLRGQAVSDMEGAPIDVDAERRTLTVALHGLLESLPQSYSGRENIKLLCDAVLSATPHLCMVWVGFSGSSKERISPYAVAGSSRSECEDWALPNSCFGAAGPYSQGVTALSAAAQSEAAYAQLFRPWAADPDVRSAHGALAIPLRAEKSGLRGLIVFYADRRDYFQQMGIATFQAFCHVAEIIWKQSNLMHIATQRAQQDALTGLMSRRYTMQALEKAVADAERSERALSILVCRLEGFGKLNDLYGWMAADAILAAFSKNIGTQLASTPHAGGGRWTGTEFLYILPGVNRSSAEALATALREHFLANPVKVKSWSVRLAVTTGVADYSRQFMGVDDLIQHARQGFANTMDELPSAIF